MNGSKESLTRYLQDLYPVARATNNVVGVCVPTVYLHMARDLVFDNSILLGAQNVFYEDSGAYTGEVSAQMLSDYSADLVLVGHSERRTIFGETDEHVNKKVLTLLQKNIRPILCVGETLQEREEEQTNSVLKQQIQKALNGVQKEDINNMWFAYEPVWAIGTGKSATSEQADSACAFVKSVVQELYSDASLNPVVLYGGSLNENNANSLLSQKHIDGGLIGGASQTVEKFEKIINTRV